MSRQKRIIKPLLITTLISVFAVMGFLPGYFANAANNVELYYPAKGTVVKVIDGEAIVVRISGSNDTAMVRLIGVDSTGYDDALTFLTSYAMGKSVIVVPDRNGEIPFMAGRYNLGYVYLSNDNTTMVANKEMLNDTLILKGYAKPNAEHKTSVYYNDFLDAENMAKVRKIGVWTPKDILSQTRKGDLVNINTATAEQMVKVFEGLGYSEAYDIENYRVSNPFNTVEEIKFVGSVTKEIFDRYRENMTVLTNINTASESELRTLKSITDTDVQRIVNYRSKAMFTDIRQLASEGLITWARYNPNQPYVSLYDEFKTDYTIPGKAVNINTASVKQLVDATGLSTSTAQRLLDSRGGNKYSFKNIYELLMNDKVYLSQYTLDRIEDNITTQTDINTATDTEIKSLFGDDASASLLSDVVSNRPFESVEDVREAIGDSYYKLISPYIYVGARTEYEYTNINTASTTQLMALGLTSSEARMLRNRTKNSGANINVDTSGIAQKISLYTNINTATPFELMTLDSKMTELIINEIILYREDQPFGSLSEVRDLFTEIEAETVYESIKAYIVVR